MRSSTEFIPDPDCIDPDCMHPDSIDISPDVCVFRHVALLHVPEPCRQPLRHLGNLLFDWSMETFGIADEEPDTEAITARRLQAIGEDLETAGHQLAALSLEPEGSEAGVPAGRVGRTGVGLFGLGGTAGTEPGRFKTRVR